MARLRAWLHEATGPAPLVAFRIGFGLLMMGAALRFWSKGWIRTHFIEPDFHFRYFLFGWIPDLPGDWLYLVFVVQIASAALIALGWRYRIAAVLFFLSFTYVELLDQATYLNHYYFISLVSFLLILLPLDRWGSLDARARRSKPASAPRWVALVLQAQIAVVYLFAGLAKLNPDWLVEAQPLRIWLSARSHLPVLGVLFDQPWFAYLMSWGGAAFDLCIPLLLLWRVTRPGAYGAVVVFHLATAVLFPIGVFPWVMIAGTLIFFDERDWRRFGDGLPESGVGGVRTGCRWMSPARPGRRRWLPARWAAVGVWYSAPSSHFSCFCRSGTSLTRATSSGRRKASGFRGASCWSRRPAPCSSRSPIRTATGPGRSFPVTT